MDTIAAFVVIYRMVVGVVIGQQTVKWRTAWP